MWKVLFLVPLMFFAGCGYSSRNNEVIGQVKKVTNNTPILCNEYKDADISLGVLRGGVGSMSSQDEWYYIQDAETEKVLRQANESGALVKIKYDVKRWVWCVGDHWAISAEIVK